MKSSVHLLIFIFRHQSYCEVRTFGVTCFVQSMGLGKMSRAKLLRFQLSKEEFPHRTAVKQLFIPAKFWTLRVWAQVPLRLTLLNSIYGQKENFSLNEIFGIQEGWTWKGNRNEGTGSWDQWGFEEEWRENELITRKNQAKPIRHPCLVTPLYNGMNYSCL